MKDSLIYITHEQNPEPIFAKAIKNLKPLAQQKENHDVINEKEMDGKCDTSFHLLSSLSLSNTDMEKQASPASGLVQWSKPFSLRGRYRGSIPLWNILVIRWYHSMFPTR